MLLLSFHYLPSETVYTRILFIGINPAGLAFPNKERIAGPGSAFAGHTAGERGFAGIGFGNKKEGPGSVLPLRHCTHICADAEHPADQQGVRPRRIGLFL
jgi:hypothetical protein